MKAIKSKGPFLLRFAERATDRHAQMNQRPLSVVASNPKEEAPRPEPTKKGPWGD